MKLDEFERILLDVLQETIDEMGSSTKLAFLYHLERKGVRFEEVPDKPEDFEKAVKEIYGPASEILFSLIFKKMSRKLGVAPSTSSGFVQRLSEIRRKWEALREERV